MPETSPLRPVARRRLYEQVAPQVLDWVREAGLQAATAAMSDHVERVSDVALLRD